MLTIRKRGFFSSGLLGGGLFKMTYVVTDEGRMRGTVTDYRFRGTTDIEYDGRSFSAQGLRAGEKTLRMDGDGGPVVEAEYLDFLMRTLDVRAGTDVWTLHMPTVTEAAQVLRRRASEVGRVARASMFTRTLEAEFDDNVPPEVQIFVVWHALTRWGHESSS